MRLLDRAGRITGGAHARLADPHAQALDLLRAVLIRDPERRLHAYPHELSGGMCQRVMIAMAIACEPALLIADEPTTGLDVTTQQAVMELLANIQRERGMAMIQARLDADDVDGVGSAHARHED